MIGCSFLVVAAAASLLAGCGDEEQSGAADAPHQVEPVTTNQASTARRGTRIRVVRSQFGSILADGRGQAVYVFDRETTRRSECYGACARAWPPVLTRGRPVAGKGVGARLIGTTRRRGGKTQVTYRGRPLYLYVDDRPGRVLCHRVEEFGGLWLVVRPDGTPAP
jgi:predicted lipoprotein with Yx(FWY)xxD motif